MKLIKAPTLGVLASLSAMLLVKTPSLTQADPPTLAELQQQYVQRGYGMFLHFNMGTFTGQDWALPNRPLSTFAPTALDTDQWADTAVAAGMKYAVLTAKHHDGFALWDTTSSKYDVASTPWANAQPAGQRDIVRRYVDSFRSRGLAVGLYYSIWDRSNKLEAGGIPAAQATQYVKDEISQLLSNYGPIDILWTDGWGWAEDSQLGPDPYAYVNYEQVYSHIKTLSPKTVLVENNYDEGLEHSDIRTHESVARHFINPGNTLPGEVADTIRDNKKWFYSVGGGVRTVAYLVDRLRASNERNAAFLLNVSPDKRGQIPDDQIARLKEVRRAAQPGNLALGKPATQSSTYPLYGGPYSAGYATDGTLSGTGESGELFSHTDVGDTAPWWEVDLNHEYMIREIDLFNRLDFGKGRFRDLVVTILNENRQVVYTSELLNAGNVLGGGRTNIQNGPDVLWLDLDGTVGRYVRVSRVRDTQLAGDNGYVLALAEVQIRGAQVPEPGSLSTLGFVAGVTAAARRPKHTR